MSILRCCSSKFTTHTSNTARMALPLQYALLKNDANFSLLLKILLHINYIQVSVANLSLNIKLKLSFTETLVTSNQLTTLFTM